jgi:UDP:flavonoid glycosyltransferase YjiC (YdhE family)
MFIQSDGILMPDLPELAPTVNQTEQMQYIGPVVTDLNVPKPDWWTKIGSRRPIIYVNMGSTGKLSVVDPLVTALGQSDATVIVATASRYRYTGKYSNIFTSSYLPGLEACKRADFVICNGGSGTTYQALACGKPVIGFPSNMDQFFVMEAIARAGAGMLIRPEWLMPGRIRKMIKRMMKNRQYTNNAAAFAQKISDFDTENRFRNIIGEYVKRCRYLRTA